jgi:UDP-3-O-[3-hydroxymyristoyl] glucosamine N-acyltransferase
MILTSTKASVIICEESDFELHKYATKEKAIVITSNAKLSYIKILNKYLALSEPNIASGVTISNESVIGKGISIGHGSKIGKALIGDNVIIGCNVIVCDGVNLKANTILHSSVVIGEPGFNYATGNNGIHYPFPHVGGVEVGEGCEIGAHSFISAGVLGPTIIASGSKLAQFVYIGANASIGSNCQIRARATVMGSVTIGNDVTIGPGVTIRDEISIGNRSIIGIGSNVLKDVPSNEVWYGNPASPKGR